MKPLKMLGLLAMAVAVLMAVAGSASAAGTFTAPANTPFDGTVSSSLEGSALLKAGFAEFTCTGSTVAGKIEATAKETQELLEGRRTTFAKNNDTEAIASITTVDFSNCKEGQTVDTLNNNGTLTILKSNTAVSGTGTEVTTAVGGVSCVYGLGPVSNALGTASNSASGVTLAISAKLPKISGGFLCTDPGLWTANYIVTSPSFDFVD